MKTNKLEKITSISFNGEINEKSVLELMNCIERIRTETNFTKVNLYFSTEGGNNSDSAILIDYLNSLDLDLEMIPGEDLSSSGFLIFMLTRCKKRFVYNTFSVIHISDAELSFRETHKKKSWDASIGEDLKRTTTNFMEFLTNLQFLSEEELTLIDKGYDISVNSAQLQQALDNFDKLPNKKDYPDKLFI